MRIAITGATGNMGTALLRRLATEPDLDLIGLARRPPVPGTGDPYDGIRWHAVDIGEAGAVDQLSGWLAGVEAVVHLAWQIQPSQHRARLRRTNVTGTANLLAAMRAAGVPKLVYASSVGSYAPGPKDRLVGEDWPTTGVPRSGYSVDKVAVERLLDRAERDDPGLRVVRLRKALVFQRDAGAEIARYFLGPLAPVSLLRWGRVPVVPANRRLRAQVVHADDAAEAYLLAVRGDVAGAFNIAADPVLDGPALAAELRGRAVPVPLPALRLFASAAWHARLQPTEPGWLDLAASAPLMNTDRAATVLGWRPTVDARHAVRDLLSGMAAGAGTGSAALRPARGAVGRLRAGSPAGHRDPA
ncbi:NAD-dependent epimerase/dehydratase family protein [Plantactinospora sp. GCM10030261]|uniref:NAD-dependent epimerase/dehydratase family protein n=1 Tax=Plantactinospora sp. GCM10030261 TaxID=3273420 RepID=UPI003606332E